MAKTNVQERAKDETENETETEEQNTETETGGAEGEGAQDGETEGAEASVYDMAVEATGLSFDEADYDGPDDYKVAVCRAFNKFTDEQFQELPDPLTDWQTAAAKVIKENRSKPKGERKKALPVMPGLKGEKEPKAAKAAKKEKEPKVKKEKEPTTNRYYKVANLLIKNPKADLEALEGLAKKAGLDYNRVTLGYCLQAYQGICNALRQAEKLTD